MKWLYITLLLLLVSCTQNQDLGGIDLDERKNQEPNENLVSEVPLGDDTVQPGKTVGVYYVGTTVDGEIFDTNRAEVVAANNLNVASTDPLTFVVGAGQMIPGFDNGVVGMKVGEKKDIVLQPDQAYGFPDPTQTQPYPRERELNRTEKIRKNVEVPVDAFQGIFNQQPENGKSYTNAELPFDYLVTEITDSIVKLSIDAQSGETYIIPGADWETQILEVDDESLTLRHNPEDGQTLQGILGPAVVRVSEDIITIIENPNVGDQISTPVGVAKVLSVSDEEIIVDFNHPLAGKVLQFEVEVVSIN